MTITKEQIQRAVPDVSKERVGEFAEAFNKYAGQFGIDTPLRTVHFLAQVLHESARLRSCEENLNYSAQGLMRTWPSRFRTVAEAQRYARKPQAIANRVYGGRMGNGPESSGDGWRYRGRGYIGLTGKSNYKEYTDSDFCNGDVVKNPDLVAKSPGNIKTAMYFWWKHKCNRLADADNCIGLTKRINGGTLGLDDRKKLLAALKKEFGIKENA